MVQLYSRVSRSLALPISTMPRFIIPLADKLDSSISGVPGTFTRNSTATYIDENRVLQTAAIDVPRFQNGRYLAEPAATNLLFKSNNYQDAIWVKNGTTVIVSDIGPGPSLTCFKLVESPTMDYHFIDQTNSILSSNKTITQSWFVKPDGRSKFQLENYNGITQDLVSFDLDIPEVFDLLNRSGVASAGFKALANGWFFVWLTSQAGYVSMTRLVLMTNRTNNHYLGDGVSGLYLYGSQLELGYKATSYIPTTTALVTRAADVLHYNVGSVITQGQGSLYCEFVGTIDPASIKIPITVSDGTTSNRFYLYISKTGLLNIEFATSGVLNGVFSSNVVSLGLNKVLITYKTGEVKLYSNGILLSTKTTIVLPLGLNKLNVGSSQAGELQLNSKVGNVKYFKEVLTPAEAIKITTL